MKTYTITEEQVKAEVEEAEHQIDESGNTPDALYWLGWKAAFASLREKGA